MAATPPPDNFRFEVDAQRERVTLEMTGGRVSLDAIQLERLAQQLGDLRATMKPEVGSDPPAASCPAIDRPLFAAQLAADKSRIALGLRMPTHGWIALMLDRGQVEGLGKYFAEIAPTMAARKD